mmetsp:Transcript_8690/g.22262  ORF Transcript_8690/g.22262 Transcript_8690/m.22262 type:complete len:214 (-) Transcript_8690:482-1123(-)
MARSTFGIPAARSRRGRRQPVRQGACTPRDERAARRRARTPLPPEATQRWATQRRCAPHTASRQPHTSSRCACRVGWGESLHVGGSPRATAPTRHGPRARAGWLRRRGAPSRSCGAAARRPYLSAGSQAAFVRSPARPSPPLSRCARRAACTRRRTPSRRATRRASQRRAPRSHTRATRRRKRPEPSAAPRWRPGRRPMRRGRRRCGSPRGRR